MYSQAHDNLDMRLREARLDTPSEIVKRVPF